MYIWSVLCKWFSLWTLTFSVIAVCYPSSPSSLFLESNSCSSSLSSIFFFPFFCAFQVLRFFFLISFFYSIFFVALWTTGFVEHTIPVWVLETDLIVLFACVSWPTGSIEALLLFCPLFGAFCVLLLWTSHFFVFYFQKVKKCLPSCYHLKSFLLSL